MEVRREQRAGPQPLPVLYYSATAAGRSPRAPAVQKSYGLTERGLTDLYRPPVPALRLQTPAQTVRRESFTAPAAATLVICPWCVTLQPGPGASFDTKRETTDTK